MTNSFPDIWVSTEIGELANIVSGGTPKASNPDNFANPGTGVAWLTPADLSGYQQKLIRHGARDLSDVGYSSCSAKQMPKGSVLFSSRAPIGYVVVADGPISTNQGFKSFVFPQEVDSSFAYHYLKHIRSLAESMGTGTTFKELSGANAKKLPFLLPSFEEQKQIAAKLDELLAQVDSIKTRLDAIPAILKRFRQSVLAAAVSGRLTERWRSENKIQPPEIVIFEELLKDKKKLSYGVLKPGDEDSKGVPMIRVMDLGEWGDFSGTKIFRISQSLSDEYKRTVVEPGDIVLSVMATVGRAAIIPDDLAGANVNRALAVIKLSDRVIPQFLLYQIMGPAFQNEFVTKQIGSAQKRINLSDLRVFKVWVPSVNEQIEIVSRIEQFFTFTGQIEQQAKNTQSRVNHLSQSILAKAFRGDLTAEWRAQNPDLVTGENSAEALLERIRSERAGHAKGTRRTPAKARAKSSSAAA